MIRLVSASVATLVAAAFAAPASAHEGAGVVHFMSQPDHVAGLILAVVAPLAVWTIARRVRNRR